MAQTSVASQYNAPKSMGFWAAVNVMTVLLVLGVIAWAAALQRRNKDLEKKVAAIQKSAEAVLNARAAAEPRKGRAAAPAPAPITQSRRRRRATTSATAPAATAPAATQAAARKAGATQPRKLITDQELARIEQLHDSTIQRQGLGTATPLDVLRARRLLNRARLLHGDVSREQYQQESDKLSAEFAAKLAAMEHAGRADPATLLEFYEMMLSERR